MNWEKCGQVAMAYVKTVFRHCLAEYSKSVNISDKIICTTAEIRNGSSHNEVKSVTTIGTKLSHKIIRRNLKPRYSDFLYSSLHYYEPQKHGRQNKIPKFYIAMLSNTNVLCRKQMIPPTIINKETREMRVPLFLFSY